MLDATNDYALYIDDAALLAAVPADVIAAAADAAVVDGKSGWKLTLRMPCYLPVLQYAADRNLRETLHRAFAVRASEFGKPEWDNTALIRRIVELRQEHARLLGLRSFANVSLAPKMARTPEEVLAFLRDLAVRAKPFAERDMRELRTFAREELALHEVTAWDVPYASEKLRQSRYGFSDQEVKRYFPEQRVLEGMFSVIETPTCGSARPRRRPGIPRCASSTSSTPPASWWGSSTSISTPGRTSAAARGWIM